jgi:hypothetical protein
MESYRASAREKTGETRGTWDAIAWHRAKAPLNGSGNVGDMFATLPIELDGNSTLDEGGAQKQLLQLCARIRLGMGSASIITRANGVWQGVIAVSYQSIIG